MRRENLFFEYQRTLAISTPVGDPILVDRKGVSDVAHNHTPLCHRLLFRPLLLERNDVQCTL